MIIVAFVAVGLIFNLVVILLVRQRRKVNEMSVFALIHLHNYGEQSGRLLQAYLEESGFRFSLATFYAMMHALVESGLVKVRSQKFCASNGKPHPQYTDEANNYIEVCFYRLPTTLPKNQK